MFIDRGFAAGVLAFSTVALALVGQAPAAAQQPSEPTGAGGIGIRLLEAPVELQNDPRALSYIVDNLPPGTAITRRIEVSNTGNIERDVSLYAAAASIGDAGFEVADDRTVNELSSWMSLTPSQLTLAPNSAAEAVVTIGVPADAPEGEQYAVVWSQTAGEQTGSGIQNVSRVGIRTYLSVGPGNGPAADLAIDGVTASRNGDGAPEVIASVTNTGGRALDPRGTVTLSGGPGGISTAPVDGAGGSIAPGDSGDVIFTLDPAIPAGPWQASVTVASGLVSKTSDVDVTFPNQGSVEAQSSGSEGVPVWTWILVALAVVVVAGGAFVAVRRRKTQ